jgi:hypothetical protein
MNDWLHSLSIVWMALTIFGFTYLVAAALYGVVAVLAVGERARSFKAISPGMLPVLGIIFGLFVAFIAAQVWGDSDRANAAVDREASALRSVVILAASFPGELSRSGRAPRNVAAGGGRRAPYTVRVDAAGITCSNSSDPTDICPVNGRS